MSKDISIPKHVAVIMDGNGRWAQSRCLPRVEGHRKGVEALERVVEAAAQRGVKTLTVFAFSSENWRRPAAEVTALMKLFALGLERWRKPLSEAGVRLRVIGDRTGFSSALNETIDAAEAATAAGSKMTLVIAANYGGRWDMLQAAQAAAAEGELTMEGVEKGFAPRSWAKWICSCAQAVSAASPTSFFGRRLMLSFTLPIRSGRILTAKHSTMPWRGMLDANGALA